MKATPLSAWGKEYAPPEKVGVQSGWDMKTPPPTQVAQMDAAAFFGLFAKLLKANPPHEMDWNMVVLLRRLGIVPGDAFEFSRLPATARRALERAVPVAQELIAGHKAGDVVDGWSIARQVMGSYGTSYTHRAHIAMVGLGANLPEDAVYPMSVTDAEGLPYHGRNRYVLHFDKDELPPVNGFWSLAMYDSSGYFVDNPARRYSIGDRDDLVFNDDGSLDIYVQHESPGKAREANWLPAPADKFNVVLRLYWPRTPILTGEWTPPALRGSALRGMTDLPR